MQVRERNKAEKRERIRRAALKLFSGHGYDATTLRDVAREAHVALGTLSLYAADKRDLTLLVFNEITVNTMETAIDLTRSRDVPLEERMLAFFTPLLPGLGQQPAACPHLPPDKLLYRRDAWRGIYAQPPRHRPAARVHRRRCNQSRGNPASGDDRCRCPAFFLIFSATARWWIGGDDPVAEEGIEYLRRLIRLQITGLSPRTARAAGARGAL